MWSLQLHFTSQKPKGQDTKFNPKVQQHHGKQLIANNLKVIVTLQQILLDMFYL